MAIQYNNTLKIIQITDTHIHAKPNGYLGNVDVDLGLSEVIKHIKQHHWPAQFLLATGDLVQDDGTAYSRFRAFLEPLGVPTYCLAGNHDIADVLASELRDGLVQWQRLVVHDHWQFILLDSSLPDSPGGHLAQSELDFLQQQLSEKPELNTMVCLHHQPVPIGSGWMDEMVVDNAEEFWRILNQHSQVRAVIWGHIHQTFTERRNGIQLFGTPSTCLQFAPDQYDPQFDELSPGYRWFELYPDGGLRTGVERIICHENEFA